MTSYIDWVLMPYITKLEGTYLPVYMISFYMLIGATDGLIQLLRSFVVSASIVGGAVSAMVLDYFGVTLKNMLIILFVLGIFAVFIEYRLYRKFKMIVQDEETIIERQKVLLNEKIMLSK